MKPSQWKSLVGGYRDALATYARSAEEVHLQAAYELGRSGLNAGLGVLDMVRLHQEALVVLIAPPAAPAGSPRASAAALASPRTLPGLAKAAETFLLEALSPFEAAHRGFRDACNRLNALNRTLNERNEQLARTNLRLEQEIIGRKTALVRAEESELKFRSVVESARDGIVTVDSSGRVVAMNKGAETMFQSGRAQLLGKVFTRLLPLSRRAGAALVLRKAVGGRGRVLERPLETRAVRRDGSEFPIELSVATWRTRDGVFFTGIVRDITERKEAELALRESRQHYIRLFEEAKAMQENLRRLSNKVLTAQEEERKHISRELHDEIAQTLTAANVSIALLRKHAESDPEFARKVESAQRLLEQSMDMVHRFARELRPSMLDHLGPFAALQNYVKSYSERTGVRVELENTARLEGLDVNQGTVLYRVAQESLTNVFKHAAATRVTIRLSQQADKVRMEIVDNGRGSDRILETAGAGQRIGVLGMQERVRLASGEFSIKSVPRRGTTVSVLLPVSPKLRVGGGSPPPNTTEPTGSIPHPS